MKLRLAKCTLLLTAKSEELSMSEKMRATNPYLQREVQEETNMQQVVESDVAAAEATWLDGNKNEVRIKYDLRHMV